MKTIQILTTWVFAALASLAVAAQALSPDTQAALACFDELTQKPSACVSTGEKEAIRQWIERTGRNCFGQTPENAQMYAGGSPLYNEQTGRSTDLLCYLTKQYPHHPWLLKTNKPVRGRPANRHLTKTSYLYENPPLGTLL